MGVLDKFFKKNEQIQTKEAPKLYLNQLNGYAQKTSKSYKSGAKEGYVENPIVHKCVSLISTNASACKIKLFDGDIEVDNHPLLSLLDRPNPMQSGVEYFHSLYSYLLISGNCYLVKDTEGFKEAKELYILRPDRMDIKTGTSYLPRSYDYMMDGKVLKSYPVDQSSGYSDIKHIRMWHPLDDFFGLSPILASAINIDQHNLAGLSNLALLKNGMMPSGMLKFEPKDETGQSTTLTDEQRARILEDLEFRFKGASNSGRVMLAEGDFDYKPMGLSPKDMSFMELMNMSAREIALVFGVPAQLVGIADQTYANVQEARLSLYEEAIIPLLKRIESDLNEWLVPLYDGDLKLRYDIDSIPAMAEKRRQVYQNVNTAVTSGIITRNEARERLGLEPIDGADTLLVPANLFPLGEADTSPQDNDVPVDQEGNEKDYELAYGVKDEVGLDTYTTEEEAQARADEIGCVGTHSHSYIDGQTVYMPCRTHEEYESALRNENDEEKQTNFPKRGDDKKISLRNSNYPLFDREFAKTIKEEHPEIWRAGGNIEGNRSFRLLIDHLDNNKETPTILAKIRERESWSARHFEDGGQFSSPSKVPNLSNIAGVVAQMKWLTIGTLGERGMKDVVMEVIKKREDKSYHTEEDEDEEETKAPISEAVRKGLQNKVKEHNDKHGDKKGKRVNVRMLSAVFRRGIGAYRNNPQSVRSNVRSEEQWAYARVSAFLRAVVTNRFAGGKFDLDLLPKDHPLSSKK